MIQSTVAECLNIAVSNCWYFRYDTEIGRQIGFKLLLAIHDAILFEVRDEQVDNLIHWIPKLMSELVVIPGVNRSLDVDIDVYQRWSEKIKK